MNESLTSQNSSFNYSFELNYKKFNNLVTRHGIKQNLQQPVII